MAARRVKHPATRGKAGSSSLLPMEPTVTPAANPWASSDDAWCRVDGVSLLEDQGLLDDAHGLDGPGAAYPTPSSLVLLDQLKRLDAADLVAEKHTSEIEVRRAEWEFADIEHPRAVARRLERLAELTSTLDALLARKDALAAELQKPYAAEAVPVEYQHHSDFIGLLRHLPHGILALPSTLKTLDWHASFDSAKTTSSLRQRVEVVSTLVARYVTFMQSLQAMRSSLRELQDIRERKYRAATGAVA